MENNIEKYMSLIKKNQQKFDKYYQILVSYNEKVNLTAITDKNEVFYKHFLDSVLAENDITYRAKVVDVGSGAGFPGLPLKIVRNDINLTMVDSLNKRIKFLDFVTNELNLRTSNIHSRVEDFCKLNREKFDVAVARAVARLNTLLEYLLPLVKIGGIVIAYKGVNYLEELEESKVAIVKLGGKIEKISNFHLPEQAGERNIIVIKKIHKTPIMYPRGQNKAKTNPII